MSAPRALALHGFLGSGADWEPFAPAFDALGLALDSPDLPGHGDAARCRPDPFAFDAGGGDRSTRAGECTGNERVDPYGNANVHVSASTPENGFQQWSEALWKRLCMPDEPALIVGYSQGGRIVLDWLARGLARPRGAVVIGSRPGFADPDERVRRREADGARARSISGMGLDAFLVQWEELPLFRGSERIPRPWWEAMQARRRSHDPNGIALALRAFGAGAMPDLRPALARAQVPLLVVWGEEDSAYATLGAELARIVPGASTAPIPRAGHRAHLENPDAFTRSLAAWWRGLAAPSTPGGEEQSG